MIRNLKLSKKLDLGFKSLIGLMGLMAVLSTVALAVITAKVNFIGDISVPVVNASWLGRRDMVSAELNFYKVLAADSYQERGQYIDEANKELSTLENEVVSVLKKKYRGGYV